MVAMSLNYLGKNGKNIPAQIKAAVAFSTPCDLKEGAEILNLRSNAVYRKRFLNNLKKKILIKEQEFPGLVDLKKLEDIKEQQHCSYFSPACQMQPKKKSVSGMGKYCPEWKKTLQQSHAGSWNSE